MTFPIPIRKRSWEERVRAWAQQIEKLPPRLRGSAALLFAANERGEERREVCASLLDFIAHARARIAQNDGGSDVSSAVWEQVQEGVDAALDEMRAHVEQLRVARKGAAPRPEV